MGQEKKKREAPNPSFPQDSHKTEGVPSRRLLRAILLLLVLVEYTALIGLTLYAYGEFVPRLNPFSAMAVLLTQSEEPRYHPVYETSAEGMPEYVLRPNFTQLFDGQVARLSRVTTVRINNDGFRDNTDYDLTTPPHTIRMIALGDSYTWGWGMEIGESWPKILEQRLNQETSGVSYEVLNFAVPGYNTAQEVALYLKKGKKYSPDYLLIGVLSNDLEDYTESRAFADAIRARLEEKNLSETEVSQHVWDAWREYTTNVLEGMDQHWPIIRDPLLVLEEERGAAQVVLVCLLNPEAFCQKLRSLASHLGWGFIRIQDIKIEEHRIHPLDHHPDVEAHRQIGEQAFTKLLSLQAFKEEAAACQEERSCYLSLGHRAAQMLPDLQSALALCEALPAQYAPLCLFTLGTQMGEVYSQHPTELNQKCLAVEARYRSNCFNRGAWTFAEKNEPGVQGMMTYCAQIDPAFEGECFNGFGDALGQRVKGNVTRAQHTCQKLPSHIQKNCFRGAGFSLGAYYKDDLRFLAGLQFEADEQALNFLNGLAGNLIERHQHKVAELLPLLLPIQEERVLQRLASGFGNSLSWHYSHEASLGLGACEELPQEVLVAACKDAFIQSLGSQYLTDKAAGERQCVSLPFPESEACLRLFQ